MNSCVKDAISGSLSFEVVKRDARGKWQEILKSLGGLDSRQLKDFHQPCPACGGVDRYRFDDQDGDGTYYCNQCGPGDGFSLLKKVNGWDFSVVLNKVADFLNVLSTSEGVPVAQKKRKIDMEEAKRNAIKILSEAIPATSETPYLKNKKLIPADEVKAIHTKSVVNILGYHPKLNGIEISGWLAVFPIIVDNTLVTVQLVDESGAKYFLPGGMYKGGFWASSKLPESDGEGVTFVIGEGVATALTGRVNAAHIAIAVLTCKNFTAAISWLKVRYPKAFLVVLADVGNGQLDAELAARMHDCRLVIPKFSSEQLERFQRIYHKKPTDLNDFYVLEGAEEVRNIMVNACAFDFVSHEDCVPRKQGEDNNAKDFLLRANGENSGLYWVDPERDSPPLRISSPLFVLAKTRDKDGKNWGRLLAWSDAEGRRHQWAMPASLACGDAVELSKSLVDGGLEMTPNSKARLKLASYVMAAGGKDLVHCTDRTGWHGNVFVLPDEVISPAESEEVFFQSDREESLGIACSGTLGDWRENVAALARGNSRLIFPVSLAFAAPLAELMGESGGFHFVGSSSIGKTTALLVACSVWGNPDSFKIMWRVTSNGVEGICFARNDLLLVLDDIGESDPKAAGEAAYMIANGQGKARSDREGRVRTPKRWRLLFLSSGEIGLSQHMADSGKQIRAGQEIRMVDLPANAGGEFGIFDVLTGGEISGSALSERLRFVTGKYHGIAGREFLRMVVKQRKQLVDQLLNEKARFLQIFVPESASGQVVRVAGRFALVAAAGELATEWGFTGWGAGESFQAAGRLFNEWLELRGGIGNAEDKEIIQKVIEFIERFVDSKFSDIQQKTPANAIIDRAGWWENTASGRCYWFNSSGIREATKGHDITYALDVLERSGLLIRAKSDERAWVRRPEGENARLYKILKEKPVFSA